jgi:hypothetical protein
MQMKGASPHGSLCPKVFCLPAQRYLFLHNWVTGTRGLSNLRINSVTVHITGGMGVAFLPEVSSHCLPETENHHKSNSPLELHW